MRRIALFVLLATLGVAAVLGGTSLAAGRGNRLRGAAVREVRLHAYVRAHYLRAHRRHAAHSASAASSGIGDDSDLADEAAQYDYERTAPAGYVTGPALLNASREAAALRSSGGAWQDVTTEPYNAQPANYTDPFWSNVGAGFSLVGGRTTALAATGDGTWFAGTADGGVWRSKNGGQTWAPVFDNMPTLSIGALAVDPADGSLWVGTGEANTSQDSYAGTGVYRTSDDGATFTQVGNDALASHTIFQLAFDPAGDAYAATNDGLFRLAAGASQWQPVLQPAGPDDFPPYDQQVTSVAVVPGTSGSQVIAAIGWHGPGNTEYNGFYQSTDGGNTFNQVTPTGDINAGDIGRTTFAYSADGSKLYAIVQSPAAMASGAISNLQGVFVANGSGGTAASVAGPWTEIADAKKLSDSGSANAYGPDSVGAQSWYNQDIAVDPADRNHLYIGLEEVFESTDGGSNWVTASQYWNYGLACGASCPNTTHPDQHGMMIAGGKIVIGNDGGVYSRPLSDTQQYGDWSDLNATLASWQYYDARAGRTKASGVAVWGGLQDNGTSLFGDGNTQMVEPAGGDGFDVVVDPQNANKAVGEYTYGAEYSTTDGGHSFADFLSPMCAGQAEVGLTPRADCDPGARFITPFVQDQDNTNTWVTGGQYVWITKDGWKTACTATACSWKDVYDTGSGNAITALSSAHGGSVIYAAWVAGGGNPGPTFGRGIATNYGGKWHQASTAGLPNRYPAGVTVDSHDPSHAYLIFNGYSRRWIPGGGTGHVFETTNGGKSWTDISGNLPDVPSDAMVLSDGKLALATDVGMFTARAGQGSSTRWSRLGTGLPDVVVDDVTPGPNGEIYAATHGRGIWRLPF